MPEPGVNGHFYPDQGVRDYDPINMAATAEDSGRIGNVAWAIFRRGAGIVLSFEALNGNRTVIPVDAPSELRGLRDLVDGLLKLPEARP